MIIGIPDQMKLEVNFNKSKYHLKDVITGSFLFSQLKTKLKHIELCINKKEFSGEPPNIITENKIITRIEIMDG